MKTNERSQLQTGLVDYFKNHEMDDTLRGELLFYVSSRSGSITLVSDLASLVEALHKQNPQVHLALTELGEAYDLLEQLKTEELIVLDSELLPGGTGMTGKGSKLTEKGEIFLKKAMN